MKYCHCVVELHIKQKSRKIIYNQEKIKERKKEFLITETGGEIKNHNEVQLAMEYFVPVFNKINAE